VRKYGCRYNTTSGTPAFIGVPVSDHESSARAVGTIIVTDTTLTGTLSIVSTNDEPTGATTTFSSSGARISNSQGNGFNGYNYRAGDGNPFGNYWQGITTAGTYTLDLTGTFTETQWEITGGTATFNDPGFACQQGGNGATTDAQAGTLCTRSTAAGGQQYNGAHLSWGWDIDASGPETAVTAIDVRNAAGSATVATLAGVRASISVGPDGAISTNAGEFRRGLGSAGGGCGNHLRWDGSKIACGQLVVGKLVFVGAVDPAPFPGDALDDTSTTPRGAMASINVLANDVGFDEPVTVDILGLPSNGSATVTGSPGAASAIRIEYVPDAGFVGTDTLSYTVSDGVDSDTAIVTVTVVGPNAVPDSTTTPFETPVHLKVAANDVGFADPVTVSIVLGPAHGTLTLAGSPGPKSDVTITYTPDEGFGGDDSFTYQIDDGLSSETAVASVRVGALARNDSAETERATPVVIDVLANDEGFEAPVTVTATSAAHGVVVVSGSPGDPDDIRITYTPATGYSGTDSFGYRVRDADSDESASVSIRVRPQAVSDSVATLPGEAIEIAVLDNDVGFAQQVIVTIELPPAHGTAVVLGTPGSLEDMTVLYTPNPGYSGSDAFAYRAQDGSGGVDTALVTIAIGADSDGDGVPDPVDNCSEAPNPNQRDTNGDGYGNVCDADFDGNEIVNFADLALFRARFGTAHPDSDFDGNGVVNFADLATFRAAFGRPPGPSGLAP
jgi:hypothetical protein